MGFAFISAAAKSAWLAATTQQAQLEGLRDEWSGQMSVRYYSSADAHLATVTHATPIVDTTTTPRSLRLGAWVAESHIVDGTAAYAILAVPAGADILRCDVSLAGAISDPGGRVRLDIGTRLRIYATAGLPAVDLPAWLTAADPAVLEWTAISGTSSGVGDVDAFCGWTLKPDTFDLYDIASGGHTNSGSNEVNRLRLLDAAPAWAQRRASTWNGSEVDVSHYASGDPAARHTYHHTHWASAIGRILFVGCNYAKGGAAENFPTVDGYDPAANDYDPAGTYTDVLPVGAPGSAYGFGVVTDGDGKIWTSHSRRYDPATDTWDYPSVTGTIGGNFPQSYSPTLDVIFGLQWGDGTGGTGMAAYKRDLSTMADSAITFSAGSAAAVSQFATDAPVYAGMDWDADNWRFLFYAGGSRVYAITPNSGTEWDMAILTTTGTAPGAASSGGVNAKWTYVDFGSVAGFVTMPAASGGVHFLRTA